MPTCWTVQEAAQSGEELQVLNKLSEDVKELLESSQREAVGLRREVENLKSEVVDRDSQLGALRESRCAESEYFDSFRKMMDLAY